MADTPQGISPRPQRVVCDLGTASISRHCWTFLADLRQTPKFIEPGGSAANGDFKMQGGGPDQRDKWSTVPLDPGFPRAEFEADGDAEAVAATLLPFRKGDRSVRRPQTARLSIRRGAGVCAAGEVMGWTCAN